MKALILVCTTFTLPFSLMCQTIAEKKEYLIQKTSPESIGGAHESLRLVNETLEEKRFELSTLYEKGQALIANEAAEEDFFPLMQQIQVVKEEIQMIQEMWRKEAASLSQPEDYALWQQPDTTLFQLIMDYGSNDYLYVIPPEIGCVRVGLFSGLPIPRESWYECLELILEQYGIGMRQLNAYVRELFFLTGDAAKIKTITDNHEQLSLLPPTSRICFILDPSGVDCKATTQLLMRFASPNTLSIEPMAGKIFLTGTVQSIQELLKLYHFTKGSQGSQTTQVVSLGKLSAKQMETIVSNAFSSEGSTLQVIPLENLAQSLFLSGSRDEVKKALQLIKDVESQIEDPQEKTVFWYVAKHSDAEELATVLAKVYDLLISSSGPAAEKAAIAKVSAITTETKKEGADLVVQPAAIKTQSSKPHSHKTADGQNNFIVDPKTGAIIMVVEQEALPKIKELLKKLDVPKKMVQIEVLLFEKKMSNQNNFGLNLVRLGSEALNKTMTGLKWSAYGGGGILDFFTSHAKGSGIPAYDLAYQFLISQQDVQINASPSITTMNQTPAKIAIVEEISIDAGVNDKNNRTYNRAQYGIIMEITPTINMEDTDEGQVGFILLDTDITFDTTKKNENERPDVTRRHIKNHVRIGDGQTVILGGLRRKNFDDSQDSIPFLGEIPGVGKLFSSSKLSDNSTEMFVFITPKIINDPIEDAEKIKREELKKRPGDVPELLHNLLVAKATEKRRLFEGSLNALFGRRQTTLSTSDHVGGEYDGR